MGTPDPDRRSDGRPLRMPARGSGPLTQQADRDDRSTTKLASEELRALVYGERYAIEEEQRATRAPRRPAGPTIPAPPADEVLAAPSPAAPGPGEPPPQALVADDTVSVPWPPTDGRPRLDTGSITPLTKPQVELRPLPESPTSPARDALLGFAVGGVLLAIGVLIALFAL